MTEVDDHELLGQYARTESEAAFATLVARYVNLVRITPRTSRRPSSSFWRAKPAASGAARCWPAGFIKPRG
jgi:hypothetical protein